MPKQYEYTIIDYAAEKITIQSIIEYLYLHAIILLNKFLMSYING